MNFSMLKQASVIVGSALLVIACGGSEEATDAAATDAAATDAAATDAAAIDATPTDPASMDAAAGADAMATDPDAGGTSDSQATDGTDYP